MKFPGFLGNEPLKEQLSALIAQDRIPQAIVLEGETGCGKRTLARLIAAALCCQSTDEKPCGRCSDCQKSLGGGHPDITTVSGGDSPRSFKIETVREMRADVSIRPNEADRKVYILENVQNMVTEFLPSTTVTRRVRAATANTDAAHTADRRIATRTRTRRRLLSFVLAWSQAR